VTKADVIAEIADKTGIDKAEVTNTLETFFSVVKDSLAEGENIYVRGFGSFINKKRAKKVARNISKNTAMVIDEHFIPSLNPLRFLLNR
jgi:DNA-binding protein HU-beta